MASHAESRPIPNMLKNAHIQELGGEGQVLRAKWKASGTFGSYHMASGVATLRAYTIFCTFSSSPIKCESSSRV